MTTCSKRQRFLFKDLLTPKLLLSKPRSSEQKKELTRKWDETFRNDYLKLNESPNWLTSGVRAFIEHKCWPVLEIEWSTCLNHFPPVTNHAPTGMEHVINFPFDQIWKDTSQAVFAAIAGLLKWGSVVAALIAIPGGAVLDAYIIAGFSIFTVFQDPFEQPRKNAVERFKEELDAQFEAVALQLTDLVMDGPHKKIREAVETRYERTRAEMDAELDALRRCLVIVCELNNAVYEVARTKERS